MDRVDGDVAKSTAAFGAGPVPVDLVTASASGLDPHITLAAALRQAASVAKARKLSESSLKDLIAKSVEGRTWGFLGEPRINVLKLNLALDALAASLVKH
jgi:K+-transporting ATPase ATPase C chain